MSFDGEANSEANITVVSFEQLQARYQIKIEAYARLFENYKLAQCKLSEARLAIQEWQDRALFYEQRHKKLISQLSKHLHETTNQQGADSTLECSRSSDAKLRLALDRLTQSATAATTDTGLAQTIGQRNREGNSNVTSDQFRSPFASGTSLDGEGDDISEKLPDGNHDKHMDNPVCTTLSKSVYPTSRAPMESSDTSPVLTENAAAMNTIELGKSKDAEVSRPFVTQSVQKMPFESTANKDAIQTRAIDCDKASLSQESPNSIRPTNAGLSDKPVCEKRTSSLQTTNHSDIDASGPRSSKRMKQVDLRGMERFAEDDDCGIYSNSTFNSKCRLEQLLRKPGITRSGHNELQKTAMISAEYDGSTDSSRDYRASERRLPTAASNNISPQRASDCLVPISKRNELATFSRNTDQSKNSNFSHMAAMQGSGEGIDVTWLQTCRTDTPSNRKCNQPQDDISPPKRHAIRSRTPPGLWETGMPDTQELKERQGLS